MIQEEDIRMKIGIIGTGDISCEMMKSAEELQLEVVSVLSRKKETAHKFASQFNIKHAFDSIDLFLKSELDIVYIGLPNSLHYEYAKQCLKNGKHVLLEKPLVLNYEQYEELLAIAHRQHVFILEVDRVNNLPNYHRIKEIIDEKAKIIQIDFSKQSRRYADYCKGELPHIFDAHYGGGALYDLGVYALHFVVGLMGEPTDLDYRCQRGRGGVDMSGILWLEYPHCLVNITLSKISHGESRVVIQGENYKIISDSAPSRLIHLIVDKNNERKEYNDETSNFTHFLRKAIQMIEKNDVDEYKQQTEKSKSVLKLLENSRKKGNIIFK